MATLTPVEGDPFVDGLSPASVGNGPRSNEDIAASLDAWAASLRPENDPDGKIVCLDDYRNFPVARPFIPAGD